MSGEIALEPYQMWLAGVVAITVLLLWVIQIQQVIRWDKRRIARYIESRGGRALSITYEIFGRGWYVQNNNTRAYAVCFEDDQGVRHQATCRTAWLAGVYFTEDVKY